MNLQVTKNLITALNWTYNEETSDDNTFLSVWTKGDYSMKFYNIAGRYVIYPTIDDKNILFDQYVPIESILNKVLLAMYDLELDPETSDDRVKELKG